MIEPDLVDGRLIKLSDVTVLDEFGYYLVISGVPARRQYVMRMRETFLKWLFEERTFS